MGPYLQRIKPEPGRAVRLALLPKAFLKGRSHWYRVDGQIRLFRCLSQRGEEAFCCRRLGERGRLRAVNLALCYVNASAEDGFLPEGVPSWQIGYVVLGASDVQLVRALAAECGPGTIPSDIDLLMMKSGDGYAFALCSPEARYRLVPGLRAKVEAATLESLPKLGGQLGQAMSELAWRMLLD